MAACMPDDVVYQNCSEGLLDGGDMPSTENIVEYDTVGA